MKKFASTLILLLFTVFQTVLAGDFTDRIFISSSGQHLPYKVIFPEGFNPAGQYPLLLFLHGAGERGTDNARQVVHGGNLLTTDKTLANAIVIAPQCPAEDYWVNIVRPVNNAERTFPENAPFSMSLSAVKELLDCFIALGFVDTSRIYGTGLSMGAFGILDLTLRYPDLFAAVEPICGGVNSKRLEKYEGRTAFRFFHGQKDDIVPPSFSKEAYRILKSKGVETELVEYPMANHNSWDPAFAEPDFMEWLFKH
ncbi:MAG: alpha/beta hydrolase-fold protein [Candidatus Cryptobacteroides sp.]